MQVKGSYTAEASLAAKETALRLKKRMAEEAKGERGQYDRTATPSSIANLGEPASAARVRGAMEGFSGGQRGGFGGANRQETDATLGGKLLRSANAGSGKFFSGAAQFGNKLVSGLEEAEQYLNGGWTPEGKFVKGDSPIVSSLLGGVHAGADAITAQANAELERSARNWSSPAGRVFNDVAVNGVAVIPQAMLAFGTGGASAAGQLGAQTGTMETALRSLIGDPRFWLSYGQNAGQSYAKAKVAGASENDALVGTFTGLTNAMIDLGGGYENSGWMNDRALRGGQIVKKLGRSVLEQSGEEYAKGVTSRLAEKLYTPDKQWYSTKDENAVFNPKRDVRQFAADAATAAIVESAGYAVRRFRDELSRSLQKKGISREYAESRAIEAAAVADESVAHENAANAISYDDYDNKIYEEVIEKAKQPGIMEIEMDEATEQVISERSFAELQPLQGKMSNRATRRWYIAQDEKIPSLINTDLSIEEQAMLACELRNQNRTWARDLMFDQEERKWLDIKYPNQSYEELIAQKMKKKNYTREEAIRDIYATATKTRKSVNEKLGLK